MLKPIIPVNSLAKNLSVVMGVILVWRGVWHLLDALDLALFGGSHLFSSLGGVILGLMIIYFPDKDFRDLGRSDK